MAGMSPIGELEKHLRTMVELLSQMKRASFEYLCFEDFVLKNGLPFTTKIVKAGFGRRGRRKECFKNAYRLMDERYWVLGGELIYCEGYAYSSIMFPAFHAWCVDMTGAVYDPTWRDGIAYYGVPFKPAYVRKIIFSRGYYGVIDNLEQEFPLLRGEHKRDEFLNEAYEALKGGESGG